jgi:hypothetical protein
MKRFCYVSCAFCYLDTAALFTSLLLRRMTSLLLIMWLMPSAPARIVAGSAVRLTKGSSLDSARTFARVPQRPRARGFHRDAVRTTIARSCPQFRGYQSSRGRNRSPSGAGQRAAHWPQSMFFSRVVRVLAFTDCAVRFSPRATRKMPTLRQPFSHPLRRKHLINLCDCGSSYHALTGNPRMAVRSGFPETPPSIVFRKIYFTSPF